MSTYIYVCLCQEQTQQIEQSTTIKSSAIKQTQTGTYLGGQTSSHDGDAGRFGLHSDTSSGQTSSTPGSPTPLPRRPQPPARRLRPGRPPPSASRQIQGPTPTSSAPAQASLPSTERLGRLKPYVYRYVVWDPYYLFPLGPKFINMGIPGKLVTYSLYFAADTFPVRHHSGLLLCTPVLVPEEGFLKQEE